MSRNISKKPVLAIISDTSMYMDIGGNIYLFEPVLREVKYFSHLFSKINWLGYCHHEPIPSNAKKDIPFNLELFIAKPSGGKTYVKKIQTILFIPLYMYKIIKIIRKSDIIHTRGPSIPALLTIIISFFYRNKKYWHKYAGTWQSQTKAISYIFQRWLLLKNIPGIAIVSQRNNTDPKHIISWLNPCLSEEEIKTHKKYGIRKNFNDKKIFCFVGRLENSKGFPALLDAFSNLDEINWIAKLHCVGETNENKYIEKLNYNGNISIQYHGVLDRKELNKIYEDSHFIILPSKSEGFPKVLVEASSFGCIPIIPSIPAIISNINEQKKNGIILEDINPQGIIRAIENLSQMRVQLSEYSKNAMQEVEKYSYEKYNHRILNEIIQN